MTEPFSIPSQEVHYDDGTVLVYPAADDGATYPKLQANPGDWVLAYFGYGDEVTVAIVTSDDLDTPISLTFGAYHDPSLADPPFASANSGSGTFTITIGSTTYTCAYSGPYCAIPPDVVDLEDSGFADVEIHSYIDTDTDPGTGRLPVTTPSSTSLVHSKHLQSKAAVKRALHPHNQGRLHYDNLKFQFVTFTGTPAWAMNWFTEDSSLPAHIRSDAGEVLHPFPAGSGSNVANPPLSSLIIFNTSSSAITVAAADGSNSKLIIGTSFDWVDPSVDLTTNDAIPIIVVGNVTAKVDSNSGLPAMKGWHANTHQTPTDSILDDAVTRAKIKGGSAAGIAATAGAVLSARVTADTGTTRGATGDVKFTGGTGVTVTRSGNTITISGSGVTSLGIAGSGTTWTGDVKLKAGTGIQLLDDSTDHGIEIDNIGVTSLSVPSGTAETGAVILQGSGGIAVTNAGSTFTVDGSGITAGITAVNINGGTDQTGPTIRFTARNGLLIDDDGSANTIAYLLPVGSSTNIVLVWNNSTGLWEPKPVSALGISGGSGLDIKSGTLLCASGSAGPFSVSFNTAFASSGVVVTLSIVGSAGLSSMPSAGSVSTTGFDIYFNGTLGANVTVGWIATNAGNP